MLTFGAFAKGLLRVAEVLAEEESFALDDIGADVAERAREKLGTYQPAVGPFPAWAPLAESTIAKKGADTPLIETGTFQGDISHTVVSPTKVTIGTHTEYIVYTELGTSRMPPRPVFGPALLEALDAGAVLPRLGLAWLRAVVRGLGPARRAIRYTERTMKKIVQEQQRLPEETERRR